VFPPTHYFLWQYAAVTTAFSLCLQEKPLLVNIWIIVNSVFFMACIVVTILGVFMLFVEWKLALLSMKGSILCAGKIRGSTSVTWAFANLATFCMLSTCYVAMSCCVLFVINLLYLTLLKPYTSNFYNKTNRRTNFLILFWYLTLHVSGNFSAHHQELSTVHSTLAHVIQF